MSTPLIVVLSIVGLLIIIIISIFNSLVSRKNQVEYANGSIDAMLKQRFDLIPNLVATVQEYMKYESGLMEKVVALRSEASKPNLTDAEKFALDKQFSETVKAFNITVENYPDLKAGENVLRLQASLNECEAQLSAARRTYNAAVMEYNNAIEMFPSSIVASWKGYKRKEMISIPQEERQNHNVANLFANNK